MPDAPRFAHYPAAGRGLLELPLTTVRLFNRNLPAGGGGYFRLLPYGVSRWCLKRVNTVDRQAVHLLFPSVGDRSRAAAPARRQPEDAASGTTSTSPRWSGRLRALLRDFAWDRMDRLFLESDA